MGYNRNTDTAECTYGTPMPKVVDHKERRIEIIKAAAEVGSLQGLSNLSLGNVATAAGVSKGLVQHYFTNKDELLQFAAVWRDELTDQLFNDAISALPEDVPAIEKLEAGMCAMIPQSQSDRYLALLGTAPFLLQIKDTDAWHELADRHERYLEHLESLFAEAKHAGEITIQSSPAILARIASALIVGVVSRALSIYQDTDTGLEDIRVFLHSLTTR